MSEPEPVYDDFRALPSLRLRPTSEELINQLSATEPKISDDNVLVIVKKLQDALSDKSVFDEFSHVGSKVLKLCCAEWVFRSFLDENVSLLTYYIRELTSSRKVEAVAKRWGVDLLVSTKDNKSLVYVYLGILAEVDLNLAALVLHRHLLAHADVETWLLDYKIVGAYCKEKSKTQHWSADKKGYIATWESTEVTLPWDSRHHPKNPLPYEEEHEARRMLFYTICRAIFLRIFAPLGYDLIEDSTDEENQEFNCYITKKTESGAVVVQADRGPFEHEHEAAGAVIIPFLRANMPTRGRFGIRSVKQLRGEQTVPVAEHQCLVDHLWTKFKTVLRTPAVASLPFSEDLFVKFSDVIEYIQGQLPDNLKEYIGDPIFEPAVLAEFLKEHDIVERFQFKEVDGIWYGRCFYYHRDIRLPKNEVGDRSDAADEGAKANDKVSANLFDNEDVYDKLCFPDEKYPHCETVDDYLTVRSIERKRLCDPGSLGQAMGKNGTQSVGLKLVPDVLLLFISEATYNASVDYAHSDDRIKKNSSTKPHIVVDIGFLLQMNYTLYQLNPNIVTRTPLIILRWPEGRPYDGPLWIPFTADSTFTVFEDGRSREEVLSQEARKHYFEVYKENCIKNDTTAKKAEKQKDEDEKRNYVENFVDDVTKRELENILVGDNDDLVARLKHHCRAHGIAVCEKETNRGRVMSFFKDHLQRFQDRLFETDTDEVKRFKNIAYLQSALRAQSISKTDNLERQEFLGDAVLDLCVALDCAHVAMAFRGCDLEHSIRGKYFTPTTQNGDVVDGEVNGLYPVTMKLLEGMEYIFESSMPLKDQKRKTYGDIFESLLGAIYLDLGLVVVHDRIKYLMHKYGHASNLYRVEKYAAAWSGTYVSMEVPLFADELLYTRERAVEFTSTEPRRFVQRAGMAMGGKPDILRGLRKVDLQKNRPFWSTHFKFEGAQSSYVRSFTNSDVHARMINAWRRRGVGLTNEAVTPMTRFAIDLDGVDAESVLFDAPLHAYAGYTIADVIQTRVCEMFRKTGLSRAHCIMLDISRANKYSQHMHWPFLPLRPQQVQCRLAELQQYIASEKIAFEKKRHGAQFVDYARSWLAKRVCAEKACSRDKVPAVRVCEIDGQVDVYCAQHPKTKKESDFTKRSITTASPSQIESAFGVRTHRMWQDYIDAGMFTSRKLRMYLSDKVDDRKGHDGEELGHPVHQRSVFLPCEVEPGVEGKLKRPVLLSHFVDRRKFHHQAVPICHFDVLNLVSLRHPSYMMDYRFEHQDQKYPGYWNALEEFSGTQQPEPDYALDSFLAACLHGFDVIERDKEKDGSKQSCDWKLPWKDDPSYRAVYMVTSRVGGDTIKDKHRIELWVDGEMLVWAERLRRPDAILKAKMELVKLIEPQAVKSLGSMLDEWSSPCRLDDDPPSEGNRSYSPPQPAPSHSKKRTKANNVLTRRFLEHNTANTPGSGTLFVPLFGLRAQGSQLLPQIQQPAALPETPRQQDQVSLQSQQRVAQPMVAQKVPETPQSEQDQVPLQTQQPSAQPVVPHQSQAASPCRQQESPTPLQTQQPSAQPIPPHHSPAVSPSGQQPQQSTAPPQTQQPPAPARELQQPEEARSAPPAARQQAPRSHEQPPASAAQPGPGAQQAPGGQPCLKPRPGSPQPQDPASCPPAQENHGTPQTGWGPDPTPPHSAAGTLVRGDSPEAAEHNGVNGAAPSAAQRPAPRSHEQPPGPAAQPGKDEQRELSGGQPCLRPRPAAPGPPSPQPQDPASASPPAQQSHGTPQPRPAMDPTPPHSATGTPVRGDSTQSAERTGAAPPPHADRRDPLPAAAFPYRTLGPSPAALGGSSPSDGRGSNGAPPPARPSAAQTSRPPGPSQEDAKRSSERSFGSPTNHATATTFGSRASIASQESPATTPTPTFKPAVGPELSMLSPALFKPPAADVGAGGNPAKKQPVKSKKTQLEREAEQLEKTQMRVRWLWGNCRSGVAQYWRGVGRRLRQGPKHVALYVPKGPCRFYCLLGILEAGLPSEVLYYGDGDDCADLPFVLHQFKYATSKDEAAKMLSVVNFVDVKSSTQLLKEPLKKCVVLNIVENEPTASFALRISFLDTTVVTKILFMSLGEDTRDEYFITNRPAEGSGKDDVLVEGVERCLFGARLQLEVCLHFQYDPLQHNATKVKETLLREYTRWRFQPLCDRNPSVPELRNFDIFNHSVMKLVRRLPPVLSTETTAAVVEALADCERKWDTMQVCTKRQQLDGVFTPTSLIVKRTLNSCRSVPLDVDSISYSMAPYKLYDKVIYICSQDIVVTEEIIRTLCGMVLPGGKVVLLLSNSIYSSGSEGNKPRLEKLHFDVLRNVPQIWKAVRRSCVLLPE